MPTDKHLIFAQEYIQCGGNASEAARRAGYQHPKQRGYELLKSEFVQTEIRKGQLALIGGELATKSLEVIQGILDDKDAPIKVRLDAAKTILDRAGISAKRDSEDDVPLAYQDMDLNQLQERLAMLQEQRAALVAENEAIEGESFLN